MRHTPRLARSVFTLLLLLSMTGWSAADSEQKKLEVIQRTPLGDLAQAREGLEITAGFNQPMVALEGVPEGNASGPLEITPTVPGKYRWRGTNILVFTPEKPLVLASEYKVRIPKGTKSLSGAVLEKDETWAFTTLRPKLIHSEPYEKAWFVERDHTILLRFNQPMDPVRCHGIVIRTKSRNLFGLPSPLAYALQSTPKPEELLLKPKELFPLGSEVEVNVPVGVLAKAGDLGTQDDRTIVFEAYNEFKFLSADISGDGDPDGSLQMGFSNPVAGEELAKNVTLIPAVKLDLEGAYCEREKCDSVLLQASAVWKPETGYQLKISGKLKDQFGQVLGRDVAVPLKTGSYQPAWWMPTGMGVLEADLAPRIPVTIMNWDTVHRRMALVPRDEMIAVSNGGAPSSFQIDGDWHYTIVRNVQKRLPLELKKVLGNKKAGFVYVDVSNLPPRPYDTNEARHEKAVMQVTGLGITGKFSPDNHLIWVTRLQDGQPVAGAAVELRNQENKILFRGKTAGDGTCEAPGYDALGLSYGNPYEGARAQGGDDGDGEGDSDESWTPYGRRPQVYVFASKGGDQAFLSGRWGMGIEPYEFGLSYERTPKPRQYQGHLFTERGLYRAGEKVFLKGVFREKRVGEWQVPEPKNIHLLIRDSRGEEVVNQDLALSSWGGLEYTYTLPAKAPTGVYSIETTQDAPGDAKGRAGQASGSFRVEAYKTAKFEVQALSLLTEYLAGQEFSGKLQGRYLFGSAMSKDKASWALRLNPYDYRPPNHEDFQFGQESWWDRYEDHGKLLASGEGLLDAQGELRIGSKLDLGDFKSSGALTLEGTVTTVDQQSQSGRVQAIVHRGDFYIGLKQSSSFLDENKPLTLEAVAVSPNGIRLADRRIQGKIIKREWRSVRKAGHEGRYEWESTETDTEADHFELVSRNQPVEHRFTPSSPGFYLLELSAKDSRGNPVATTSHFYVSGSGYVGWERRNDDRIDLVADKSRYRAGDRAHIMIKSPYDRAQALITLEREYVLERKVVEVKGSAPVIEIPITDKLLPNVYVSVTLVKGRLAEAKYNDAGDDLSKPSFKMGYINLPVDASSKRLAVIVHTDKPVYQPRDTVNVDLEVKTTEGKGIVSEITLAVVDKGVLNLIDYQTPDSFEVFYGSRPLSVASAETRLHVIGQRNYGEKGENRGGGGGNGQEFRGEFLTTPYYTGRLFTDASGKAKASFKLPDNLTTFKVMATVQSSRSKFGAGDNTFKVSKPLLMMESLPRFLRLGDMFSAGVTLHSMTETAQNVEVTASAEGVTLTGQAGKTSRLEPHQAQVVRFNYAAPALGSAVFKFKLQGPAGKDGLKISLPVLMPRLTEAVALYSQTEGQVNEAIKIPENIYPNIGEAEFTASSTALVGLESNLDYLIAYPYGCMEQKLSQVLPLILAENIIRDFKLAPLQGKDLRKIVQSFLEEAPQFQRPDGGFAFWKDSPWSCPFLTAYALYVFYQAKQQGYNPDEEMVHKAVAYLRQTATQPEWDWPYSKSIRNTTAAYMQYVLSLWGQADAGLLNRLYDDRNQLTMFGQAMLMRALRHTGAGETTAPTTARVTPLAQPSSWFGKLKNAAAQVRGAILPAGTPATETMLEELKRSLMNKIMIAPTTAHFEETEDPSGEWIFQSNVRTSALILATLLETKGTVDYSERMIKWLMDKRRNGRWNSTQDNIYVFEALNLYYQLYESQEPHFTAQIQLENREILKEIFSGWSLDARRRVIPLSEIPHGRVLPVTVGKTGTGRLYYGIRFNYAPQDPVLRRDEGLAVEKRIEPLEGGNEVTDFQVGKIYKVQLKISTLQERTFVVVDDPLPAGFEVVNTSFATESQELVHKAEHSQANEHKRWWGSFDHFETYDDKVLLFANALIAGDHTYSYFMRASTPGHFYQPSTKAEEMYTPEVFGWCPDRRVEIRPEQE